MGQSVWAQCLAQLEGELSPQQFNTWIRPLHAVTDGAECTLLAPNHFVRDWVTQHFAQRISELLRELGELDQYHVQVQVGSRSEPKNAVNGAAATNASFDAGPTQ